MCPRIYLPMGSAVCLALLFSTSEIWAQGRPPAPGRGGAPVEQQGRGARSGGDDTERQGDWRGRGRGPQGERGQQGEREDQGERGSAGQDERGWRREPSRRGEQGEQQAGEETGRRRWSGRGDRGGDPGGEEGRREPSGRGRWSGRGERGDGAERGESGRGESGRGESGRGESRSGRGRGEGDEGGSRQGDREASRESGRSRRSAAGDLREQVVNQLVALDLNQNGRLEPVEANSLSVTIMRQLGLDPGSAIYLDTLRSLVSQLELETIPFETDAGLQAEGERASFEFPSVPTQQRGRGENMGFAGTENPILSDPTPMEERYSPLVLEEVRSLLARYDANSNGVLDPAEIAAVPWATANPLESDLDQDGRLADIELAERMKSIGGGEETTSRRSRRSRTRSTEEQEEEEDPRAAARAAAEEERERRAEERKQRERERKNSGPTDRVATYVKDLIGKLDTDEDGSLTMEEVSAMRNPPPKSADKDENGVLTYEELYGYYGDGQSPSGSSSSRSGSGSRSSASDRGPLTGAIRWDGDLGPGMEDEGTEWPAELARKDQDNDGMISLAEFSTNLSAAERESFSGWDRNGDGYITLSEAQQPGRGTAPTRSSGSRGERETNSAERSRSSTARRGATESAAESPSSSRRSFGRSRSSGEAEAASSDGARGSNSERTSDRSGEARRSRSSPRSSETSRDSRGNASESGSEQAPPANALRYSIFGN